MQNLNFERFAQVRCLLSGEGIGALRTFNLLKHFGSIYEIFSADMNALRNVDGINKKLASKIQQAKDRLPEFEEPLRRELKKLTEMEARVVYFWDDEYPKLLKRIYSPPVIIYMLGKFEEIDNYSIAVVGTRTPTHYGRSQAQKISRGLAAEGITIVSGMARGIDSIAHRNALEGGARTIAVIGSGLDVLYPPENRELFNKIKNNGCVISEFPLGTKPDAQNFPQRNRIISGISLGTVIIETRLTGGAMQTASFALDQNREIFAVPGNVGVAQSEGTNALIQRGEAKLITGAADVIAELEYRLSPALGKSKTSQPADLNLFEEKIYNALEEGELHIDAIGSNTQLSIPECLAHLLSLEFKGLVRQLPGKVFIRI